MKSIKVNADYETELFHSQLASKAVNETIEFFLFFLSDRELYTQKKYDPAYLEYVEKVTGHEPRVTPHGPYENYWGLLADKESEKWWNSKITSTELIIRKKWCENTFILRDRSDLVKLDWSKPYLLKDPHGMSGMKFQLLKEKNEELILKALKGGPQIIEPWFDRKFDFSQYVFPDGKTITYQNQVDARFQYKGSFFDKSGLPFSSAISEEKWKIFRQQTEEIKEFYAQKKNEMGYSIDSFIYEENGELQIRVMSEINYRRTMGRVAYELAQKFAPESLWSAMTLSKVSATPLWKKVDHPGIIVLSPGDSRFEICFLFADSEAEGKELLAYTESAVNI